MVKDILNSIPVLLISIVATVTGGTAISKVAQDIQPALANDMREVQEVRAAATDPTITPSLIDTQETIPTSTGTIPSTSIPLPTLTTGNGSTQSNIATSNTFTQATLAQHNTAGSCYVAYNKVIYDVSNHPSWQNCMHHGTTGGRDITSTFPHSTSYFNSLPKVGTLTSGSTSGSGSSSGTSGSHEDDDDESDEEEERQEDEDEHESEDEDELEIENEDD
jgi:predicted heme/steroid binding protein